MYSSISYVVRYNYTLLSEKKLDPFIYIMLKREADVQSKRECVRCTYVYEREREREGERERETERKGVWWKDLSFHIKSQAMSIVH